jgi:hypothetical protein
MQLHKIRLWIFPVCLGLLVAWVSLTHGLGTRADLLHNLWATLHGQPFCLRGECSFISNFYNRVMFPLIHQGLSRLLPALSAEHWYVLLRVVSFQLAFFVFTLACVRALKPNYRDYCLAATLLALSFIISFNFIWESPSDALDIVALSLGVLASLSGRFFLALGVALLFATNRESAAFIGIIWIILADHDKWPKSRRLFEGLFISALSYAVSIALRYYIAGPSNTANRFTLLYNLKILVFALTPNHAVGWWLALLLSLFAIILISINYSNALARRFVALAVIFAVPNWLFGVISEIRVSLPTLLMMAFAVAANKEHSTRDAGSIH